MIVFVLIVDTAILPVNPRSQVWGHQLSSTVLNVCLVPRLALSSVAQAWPRMAVCACSPGLASTP